MIILGIAILAYFFCSYIYAILGEVERENDRLRESLRQKSIDEQ